MKTCTRCSRCGRTQIDQRLPSHVSCQRLLEVVSSTTSGSHMRSIILMVFYCLSITISQAAGIKFVQVPADANGPALKAIVWTPCAAASHEIPIGPYILIGQRDCPTLGKNLPLVVISHGHGGSFLGHHDLAEVLADSGFVVAAINHPGDTFSDMSRAADMSVFVERPTDIKRLIDYMLSGVPDASNIDSGSDQSLRHSGPAQRVSDIGHRQGCERAHSALGFSVRRGRGAS